MSAELLKDGEVIVDFGQNRQALSEYLNRPIPWGNTEYPVRSDETIRIRMERWSDPPVYHPEQLPTVGHLLGAIYTYFNLLPLSEEKLRKLVDPRYLDALLEQSRQGNPVTRVQIDPDHVFFEGFYEGESEGVPDVGTYYILLGS